MDLADPGTFYGYFKVLFNNASKEGSWTKKNLNFLEGFKSAIFAKLPKCSIEILGSSVAST